METQQDEQGSIKELRDAAERGRKASQELDAMKREMTFLKAGVNLDCKAGQLLLKAYDGDLEVDLIRAEAEELNAITSAPFAPEAEEGIDTSTAERQALAQDSTPPEATTASPYETGHQQYKDMIEAGRPSEDAAAAFVSTILEAAGKGDDRVTTG